ncbi:hypothetical protein E2I00_009485 [Balaenoptera physalus]|uniref:Large ribosomal subunit protein uL4m n=1 Tax=Balaenoptera physalus TaxID=9770 RepID=A0A643CJU8_BALPH|nr:hypothetical protein E2I00_009485 [Balaenoptera physalus]
MLQLVRAGARAWLRPKGCRGLKALAEEAVQPAEKPEPVASAGPRVPVLRRCELPVLEHRRPVQAWVEALRGYEQERLGLTELHPDVFSATPRLDILHQVAIWQKNFKRIKGSGRARHGSIRSPIWRGGGIAHGPRGPTSYYYMLPMKVRVQGLKVALTTFNLVPAIGLNVHSMLKHQTLVLTLPTVAFLEEKLLWHDSRYTPLYPFRLPYRDFP